MLEEIRGVRQDDSTQRRQWFQDDYFDLFVWSDSAQQVNAFQLCYDRLHHERVLEWRLDSGLRHRRVDDGESWPGHKMAPVMTEDGRFAGFRIAREFDTRAMHLPPALREFIRLKIAEAGARWKSPRRR